MIQQNLMMCRETRRLLNELESMANESGIATLVTPSQIYIAEQVILKYYTSPVLNMIKSKLKNIKSKSSRHFTVEYWTTVIDKSFTNVSSVLRDNSSVIYIDNDHANSSFMYCIQYMITDYSIYDAMLIYDIIHKYSDVIIKKSIQIGRENNVYNIQYIKAVIEKEQALSNIKVGKIEALTKEINKSDDILSKKKISNTIMDIATMAYNWDRAREDAELTQKFNNMFGGDDK